MPCQFCPHCQEEAKTKKNPNYLAVQELWDFGISQGWATTKQNFNRFAIARLLRTYDKEKLKKLVEYSQKIRASAFAPQVYNFMDLEEKLARLLDYASRNGVRIIEPEATADEPRIIGYKKLEDGSMQPIIEKSRNRFIK